MRLADIFGLALSALWQQKVRTALTTLGVVFGSFVLAASLSTGQGVQETIERETRRSDFLRRIAVRPDWRGDDDVKPEDVPVKGQMSEAKRQRIRKALIAYKLRLSGFGPRVTLTAKKLQELAALEHVETVVPLAYQYGFAVLNDQAQTADVGSALPDNADCLRRLEVGRFFETAKEHTAVVSEFLLYRCGITDDAAVSGVLGKKVRLEFRPDLQATGFSLSLIKPHGEEISRAEAAALDKLRVQLPTAFDKFDLTAVEKEVLLKALPGNSPLPKGAKAHAEEFTVVGVLRLPNIEEREGVWDALRVDAEVVLPLKTGTDLFFRSPGQTGRGVDEAVVIVDKEENVKEVVSSIKALGLSADAALEFIDRERLLYLLIFGAMTFVSVVALVVAALGITNTMLMSVLERAREVGIMKAVGAGNGHVQMIFLVEGALIGLLGGGLGLLLSWAASFPADGWVRGMVSRDLKIELKGSLFVFPLWLVLMVLGFAVVVTTLAAVYPARRAAQVDPVAALRHE